MATSTDAGIAAHRSRARSLHTGPCRQRPGLHRGTGTTREITHPAASPKAICEAMNHGQSMRALSVGLTTPNTAQIKPVHNSGAIVPPHSIWRRGIIGSMTA